MTRVKSGLVAALVAMLGGCIVRDNLTTLTIHPDGSADLVAFCSNIRSTEQGAKADEELRKYAEEFDARKDDEFVRIESAGGRVVDAWWVRREAPYSNIISARLPSAAALERFTTIEGNNEELRVMSRYSKDGAKRRLSMSVQPPKDFNAAEIASASVTEARQKQANGLAELRLVMLNGEITATRGWTVATDKRSALLGLNEIADLLRATPNGIEVFIEWELRP